MKNHGSHRVIVELRQEDEVLSWDFKNYLEQKMVIWVSAKKSCTSPKS